jgi:hypothetical protein
MRGEKAVDMQQQRIGTAPKVSTESLNQRPCIRCTQSWAKPKTPNQMSRTA